MAGVRVQNVRSTAAFFSTEWRNNMIARLTKYEKETIILTNDGEIFWTVFTYNKRLQRRLMIFAEHYPENCRFESQNNEGGIAFEIDKGRLSIRLTAPYTEDRRKTSRERAKKHELNGQ